MWNAESLAWGSHPFEIRVTYSDNLGVRMVMDFTEKVAHVGMVEIDSGHTPRSHQEILPTAALIRPN
jgi:hypothetical protein